MTSLAHLQDRFSAWYWSSTYGPTPMHERCVAAIWRWLSKGSLTRRTVVGAFTASQVAIVLMVWFAPEAAAATSSGVSGVAWTRISDSDGVPLANYMFITNTQGFFDWESKALSGLLKLEASLFTGILALGLWAIGWAINFGWLDWLRPAAEKVEQALGFFQDPRVLALTMTVAAASIGIPWLLGRKQIAVGKVVMVVVITLGGALAAQHSVAYISEPGGGPLAYGRDVGVSLMEQVDPSIKGESSAGSVSLLTGKLVDSLGRKPLQLWNFGTVTDNDANCRSAWTAATKAGDEDDLITAMENCGSEDIKDSIQNPSGGQFGTGLLALIASGVILFFLVLAALKVIEAAAQALFYAVLTGPAFALAYLGGGSAAFAFRCFADAIMSGLAMGAYTVFLAGSMLVVKAVISANAGSLGPAGAMIVLAIFVWVLSRLLRRLSGHLELDAARITKWASWGSGASTDQSSPFHQHITQRVDSVADGVPGTLGSGASSAVTTPIAMTARVIQWDREQQRRQEERQVRQSQLAATHQTRDMLAQALGQGHIAPAVAPAGQPPVTAAPTMTSHLQHTTQQAAAFQDMVSSSGSARMAVAEKAAAPEVAAAAAVVGAVAQHHRNHQAQHLGTDAYSTGEQARSGPPATVLTQQQPTPPATTGGVLVWDDGSDPTNPPTTDDGGSPPPPAASPVIVVQHVSPQETAVQQESSPQQQPIELNAYSWPGESGQQTISHPPAPLPATWSRPPDPEPTETAEPIQPPAFLPPGWGR